MLVFGLLVAWLSLSAQSGAKPDAFSIQLCTCSHSDAVPPGSSYSRLSIEPVDNGYELDVLYIGPSYESGYAPRFRWQTGMISKEDYEGFRRKVGHLQPESIESSAPPRRLPFGPFVQGHSWVTVKGLNRNETRIFLSGTPREGWDSTLKELPDRGRDLLELLWKSQSLAKQLRNRQGIPPFFSGYCFEDQQRQLNNLIRELPGFRENR